MAALYKYAVFILILWSRDPKPLPRYGERERVKIKTDIKVEAAFKPVREWRMYNLGHPTAMP